MSWMDGKRPGYLYPDDLAREGAAAKKITKGWKIRYNLYKRGVPLGLAGILAVIAVRFGIG